MLEIKLEFYQLFSVHCELYKLEVLSNCYSAPNPFLIISLFVDAINL